MSLTKEQIIKGLDAVEGLINEQTQLRRDGLIFIFEQGLWKKFMDYHIKQHVKRSAP